MMQNYCLEGEGRYNLKKKKNFKSIFRGGENRNARQVQ